MLAGGRNLFFYFADVPYCDVEGEAHSSRDMYDHCLFLCMPVIGMEDKVTDKTKNGGIWGSFNIRFITDVNCRLHWDILISDLPLPFKSFIGLSLLWVFFANGWQDLADVWHWRWMFLDCSCLLLNFCLSSFWGTSVLANERSDISYNWHWSWVFLAFSSFKYLTF